MQNCLDGRVPDELAKKGFGDRLFISSLAVVDEGSKVRVVHDASNEVHLIHRIKVGIYGVGSAGYYLSRLAAYVHRLGLYVMGDAGVWRLSSSPVLGITDLDWATFNERRHRCERQMLFDVRHEL